MSVIIYADELRANVLGRDIVENSPTKLYVSVIIELLTSYPNLVGQKETHFTADYSRASTYTGTTRECIIQGRTVYIKTGFSSKDKWKGIEKTCELTGISFSLSEGGVDTNAPAIQTAAPSVNTDTPTKACGSKKTNTDPDYAELAEKYAAQPVNDDFCQYNHVYGGGYVGSCEKVLHDEYCECNLVSYKGYYYYIKPLKGKYDSFGLFRSAVSEGAEEKLLVELSDKDVESNEYYNNFVPIKKLFNIHRDFIYFRKDSAIYRMHLSGRLIDKIEIHKDEWRLYSPYPFNEGIIHLNQRRDTLYFFDYITHTDSKITAVKQVLGYCGHLLFFLKPGSSEIIAVFDSVDKTVTNLRDWMPILKKKHIILIDCRHEIIYYTENSGNNSVPTHKKRIYGINFSGEVVDLWEAPKLPDFEFDSYSGIVFSGEVYALKTVEPTFTPNKSDNNRIRNYCVYSFTRSGEVKTIYKYINGGLKTRSNAVNAVGNVVVTYLDWQNYMIWSLIPVYRERDYIILYDPSGKLTDEE